MNRMLARALCATTALASGLLIGNAAMAQSSGTTAVEELVVTGSRGPADLSGVIVAERDPKSRASISEEFIQRQVPGQTILQSLNLMPGVNFTNNDAFGSAHRPDASVDGAAYAYARHAEALLGDALGGLHAVAHVGRHRGKLHAGDFEGQDLAGHHAQVGVLRHALLGVENR